MEEPNNCPRPDCGRPESTHRWSAGKKLSICGNGHSWDQQEVAAQRAKAKAAERQEHEIRIKIRSFDEIRKQLDRAYGGPASGSPFIPNRNPFE